MKSFELDLDTYTQQNSKKITKKNIILPLSRSWYFY